MAKQVSGSASSTMLRPAAPSGRRRVDSILGRDWRVAWLFVLPLIVLMAGLIFWPFVSAILISFTTRSIRRTEVWVGLDNYIRLWSDPAFRGAIANTVLFTVASVGCKLVVGTSIALLLNSKLPFRNVLTGIMLLPWIVPEVVTAMAWRSIYDPIFGGLNPILQRLGLIDRRVAWLAEPALALPSVIAVNIWKGIPFFTMLLLAGLKAIDRELYEAAEVDGATVFERFRHITVPGLRYVIAVTVLLSTITTFNTFGLIYLLTGGGPGGATRVYSILAYERAIVGLRYGPGVAVALSTAPLLMLVIFVLARYMRGDMDSNRSETAIDRALGALGRGIAAVVDALLWWPLSMVAAALTALLRGLRRLLAPLVPAFRGQGPALTHTQRERTGTLLRIALIVPFLVFVLFPFYWVFITAFKSELQIQRYSSIYWPDPWTLDNLRTLLTETGYTMWYRNTLIVASSTTVLAVLFAALGGYALARLKFLGAAALTTVLLITYLLPGALMFIPLYRILAVLGIINTHLALIVTYPTFMLPFATWVLLGYYRSIPEDLEEAAMIDGATRLGAFWRITLPLATPALLAVTLFSFTNAWNEFLFAFVFLTSEKLFTLPVGLQQLVFADIYPWGQLMCASLLMAIPVVIAYIYAQKYMVEGLTAGSVKG